jgi:putative ABC transport system permease protein
MGLFQLFRAIQLGIKSLMLHKLRSSLTVLGIVFGVCSVIAMLAIGEGASYEVQERIKRQGANNIFIKSIKPIEDRQANTENTNFTIAYGITYDDAERMVTTIPGIEVVVPMRRVQEELRNGYRNVSGDVISTVPWYGHSQKQNLVAGRYITFKDMHARMPVAVVNAPVVRALFPAEDPLGKTIKANRFYFKIIGVLDDSADVTKDESGVNTVDTEHFIHIPLTTSEERFGVHTFKRTAGSRESERVELHQVNLVVDDTDKVLETYNVVKEMMERFHKKKDYEIIVPLALLKDLEQSKRMFSIVLGSIAAISLLVGGIGIMNIMLASITERTREIGIRRALGAKKKNIITQFLVETVVLSAGGGFIGVIFGMVIPELVEHFADMKTIVKPMSLIMAFSISAGIGIVFGLYPAIRAANMDPIEALRHE